MMCNEENTETMRHVHWKPVEFLFPFVECSGCGRRRLPNQHCAKLIRPIDNYCSNCGGRYDEPDEVEWYDEKKE